MSLGVYLVKQQPVDVYSSNITHNLEAMAKEADLASVLWRPEEHGLTHAHQLIDPLTEGLALLKSDPVRFQRWNPTNGWGDYHGLVKFVEEYLQACLEHPDAEIQAYR